MTENWTEGKERKALRKYRFVLTLKILRILLIIGAVWITYQFALHYFYSQSDSSEKLKTYAQLHAEWTMPGVRAERSMGPGEISSTLTESVSVDLMKRIGGEEITVGTREAENQLIGPFSRAFDNISDEETFKDYTFFMPEHPGSGNELGAEEQDHVWETLDMIHEGTVAELAFSLDGFYEGEEVMEWLEEYELAVTWMPLYMGEFTEFTPGYGSGGDTLMVDSWGLTQGQGFDENWRNNQTSYLSAGNMEEIQGQMLENMKMLYEEDESLVQGVFGLSYLEERIGFIEREGFQVYGAVVTGPSKELLELQEDERVRGAQLGRITHWNWEGRFRTR